MKNIISRSGNGLQLSATVLPEEPANPPEKLLNNMENRNHMVDSKTLRNTLAG
jgi:hypothetical protein